MKWVFQQYFFGILVNPSLQTKLIVLIFPFAPVYLLFQRYIQSLFKIDHVLLKAILKRIEIEVVYWLNLANKALKLQITCLIRRNHPHSIHTLIK